MTLLEIIQTRYSDAQADQFEVQDFGDGPFFSRWEVLQDGERTPEPTYEDVMSWEDDAQAERRAELADAINLLAGQSFATLRASEKWLLVEGLALKQGALTDESKVKPFDQWDVRATEGEGFSEGDEFSEGDDFAEGDEFSG